MGVLKGTDDPVSVIVPEISYPTKHISVTVKPLCKKLQIQKDSLGWHKYRRQQHYACPSRQKPKFKNVLM